MIEKGRAKERSHHVVEKLGEGLGGTRRQCGSLSTSLADGRQCGAGMGVAVAPSINTPWPRFPLEISLLYPSLSPVLSLLLSPKHFLSSLSTTYLVCRSDILWSMGRGDLEREQHTWFSSPISLLL